jgi:hypothetical protein
VPAGINRHNPDTPIAPVVKHSPGSGVDTNHPNQPAGISTLSQTHPGANPSPDVAGQLARPSQSVWDHRGTGFVPNPSGARANPNTLPSHAVQGRQASPVQTSPSGYGQVPGVTQGVSGGHGGQAASAYSVQGAGAHQQGTGAYQQGAGAYQVQGTGTYQHGAANYQLQGAGTYQHGAVNHQLQGTGAYPLHGAGSYQQGTYPMHSAGSYRQGVGAYQSQGVGAFSAKGMGGRGMGGMSGMGGRGMGGMSGHGMGGQASHGMR